MKLITNTNPILQRLEPLIGEWELTATVSGAIIGGANARFEWIDGGAFVIQHADAGQPNPDTPAYFIANSPFPLVTIFGLDGVTETFTMLTPTTGASVAPTTPTRSTDAGRSGASPPA